MVRQRHCHREDVLPGICLTTSNNSVTSAALVEVILVYYINEKVLRGDANTARWL